MNQQIILQAPSAVGGTVWCASYSRAFPTTLHRWCAVPPYQVEEARLREQLLAIAPRIRAEHWIPLMPPSAAGRA
ncbi:hypothetical protein [Variovorax sp. J31P207]|uniref:hypothetical protein n=1 Tax=Variovorax sp. J31P207 TaxID=3053510 RepID=UPI0025782C59|nr:hypothetical protein [Variovorax sp. J31P207]MDM0067061.1 hypothetical protein [Variovorax sp. J31P207]